MSIMTEWRVKRLRWMNAHITNLRSSIFTMNLSGSLERMLMHRIRLLSWMVGGMALLALLFMLRTPGYFVTALLVGLLAMGIDFLVEYSGISRNSWDYPTKRISFRNVPVEVPLLFFGCGVLAVFVFSCFSTPVMAAAMDAPLFPGVSMVQMFLLLLGTFFLAQYFRGRVNSLVFGALPMGIALYLAYPEPWVLVVSILPIYADYYLEKMLVRSANIRYDNYDDEVAVNVAISYFPAALFIMGCAAIILNIIGI